MNQLKDAAGELRLENEMLLHQADQWLTHLRRADNLQQSAHHAALLGWIMGLPKGLDPATAASAILVCQSAENTESLSAPLTALLRDVAAYPVARLRQIRQSRRVSVV